MWWFLVFFGKMFNYNVIIFFSKQIRSFTGERAPNPEKKWRVIIYIASGIVPGLGSNLNPNQEKRPCQDVCGGNIWQGYGRKETKEGKGVCAQDGGKAKGWEFEKWTLIKYIMLQADRIALEGWITGTTLRGLEIGNISTCAWLTWPLKMCTHPSCNHFFFNTSLYPKTLKVAYKSSCQNNSNFNGTMI